MIRQDNTSCTLLSCRFSRANTNRNAMKKRPSPSVTGAELKVLGELWQRGEATIRDLRDLLYPEGGNSKFATVQKLLARLVAKNLVGRRKDAANWIFHPLVARDDLIGGELRRVADRLGGNSMTPLLTCLVETGELSAKERAHLRQLLDEPANEQRTPRKHKS
jgi:BlaI family transcriptional regulator, penicillinase repressor